MALGELALEEGDYASARWYWERIIPARIAAEAARSWPGFPDTDLDLAAVRARLVLVSILEGSAQRAAEELSQLARLHPEARGWLGGREVNYVEALGGLLAESAAWPRPQPSPDWPTFAGSPARNKVAADLVDVGTVDWRMPLRPVRAAGPGDAPPSAELSYHPVYADGLLLLGDSLEIRAVEAATGQAAWGGSGWTIYRDQLMGVLGESIHQVRDSALGVPRHTMTEFGGRLYARMGSPATGPGEAIAADVAGSGTMPGYLVCLDLAAEGRLVWKIAPEEGWAFEGSPVVDGANVYVGVRRGMVPEADVACFDAETGRLRWRVFVCSAETPGRGTLVEYAHNLLTLQGRTLYYNTNLGAVAAISAQDGRIRWVSLYPRATEGRLPDLAPHWRRDLNPCLYDHGTLLVAPADSPRIFALDAGTGQILWQTGEEVQGALDLLGTTEEYLIAGGDRLYWIAMAGDDRGRVKYVWPQSDERPGFGRGVLSGQSVLWPTREKLYVFDQHTARLKKAFDLDARGASGGNLLVADGRLVIATATELIALGQYGGAVSEEPGETKIGQPAGQPLDPQLSTLNQPH
jgi:outer membrane protein assembly factor BamB